MAHPRIAVLGAGIMGVSTALWLARGGASVDLFDAADRPFSAASRWNEGKIHLGFLYNADPSMRTVDSILPGGLLFKPLVEELVDRPLDEATTQDDDIYLCHRQSVVMPGGMHDYFDRLATMIRHHPDAAQYLTDVSDCKVEKLSAAKLGTITDSPEIVAGFRVPERSVSTTWVADAFVSALSAESRIELVMGCTVTGARPVRPGDTGGGWLVEASGGSFGPYDFIVNALWEGRMAVDATAGLAPSGTWTNRYRRSLFVRTGEPLDVPSAIITTGPFGDVKNYNGHDFYLSWYPLGLAVESGAVTPPSYIPPDDKSVQALCRAILDRLGELLPPTRKIRTRIESMRLEGGWVFAAGAGALNDPRSTLHRRSDFGIVRLGSYISVDTGKYSTAPWLAGKVADMILL